jgi:hypothetical protein
VPAQLKGKRKNGVITKRSSQKYLKKEEGHISIAGEYDRGSVVTTK